MAEPVTCTAFNCLACCLSLSSLSDWAMAWMLANASPQTNVRRTTHANLSSLEFMMTSPCFLMNM